MPRVNEKKKQVQRKTNNKTMNGQLEEPKLMLISILLQSARNATKRANEPNEVKHCE